jgi:cytosine/adenosine deaminase-related metal-dependent hydrolase
MHAAEGTDRSASREIDALFEADVLDPRTVLIHGVGIEAHHLKMISSGGSSLVWCPTSNIFLLGRTLRDEVFMAEIPIALGSDSALTAQGDLLDELRFARSWTSPERLYRMVTCDAAHILKLPAGFGHIQEGGPADFLVIADGGVPPAQALMNSLPEMVIVRGRIVVVSDRASKTLDLSHSPRYPVHLEGRGRYLFRSSVTQMIRVTRCHVREDLRLAGKLLTQ